VRVRSDGLFSKSDPFWSISKRRPDGVWVQVAKSGASTRTVPHACTHARRTPTHTQRTRTQAEVINNDLNPTWKAQEISLQHLCNGDMHRELKLEILHKEKDDKFIESACYRACTLLCMLVRASPSRRNPSRLLQSGTRT
jgi:hypothetical protein